MIGGIALVQFIYGSKTRGSDERALSQMFSLLVLAILLTFDLVDERKARRAPLLGLSIKPGETARQRTRITRCK